jgi:hypothetical protein
MGVESSSMVGDIGVRKDRDREKEMVVSIIREYVMSGEFMDRMRRSLGIVDMERRVEEFRRDIERRVEEKASKVELSEAIMMIKDLIMMLRGEMNKRFEQMDKRLEQMDRKFEGMIMMLRDEMNRRFEQVDRRFDDMVKMFYRLFWLIIAFFTPLSVSMIGLLWKLFH